MSKYTIMQAKKVLISGATDGIGLQTAKDMARKGYKVYIHGRTRAKAQEACEQVKAETGSELVDFMYADLSSFEEMEIMQQMLYAKMDSLDVLINNAGVISHERAITPDGFELTFQVNHLSYFILGNYALPLLKQAKEARIVNVSSQVHASDLDFDNLQGEKHYTANAAYSLSKLCNVLYTYYLAYKLLDTGITVNCLHPGVIKTKLLRSGFGAGFGSPLPEGSKNSVYVATSADLDISSGLYFVNQKPVRSSAVSYIPEIQQQLWDLSEKYTGLKYSF